MPYPYTNATTYIDLVKYANTVTDGWFGASLVFMCFIIAFMSTRQTSLGMSLGTSSFISLVISSLLFAAGLVSEFIVYMMIILTGLSLFVLIKEKD